MLLEVPYYDWLGDRSATSLQFWDQVKETQEAAAHWRVDGSAESRDRLLYHLEVRTNMKRAFLHGCDLAGRAIQGTVVDLGAGIGWTSAHLSRLPDVSIVYVVDIGVARLMRTPAVFDVLGGDKTKLRIVRGGFTAVKLPDKSVNCLVMNGAFHHCYDEDAHRLLQEAHRVLADDGVIMISNEHYVGLVWYLKGVMRSLIREHRLQLRPSEIRKPLATSGEHWRTLGEIKAIWEAGGLFCYRLEELDFDACNRTAPLLKRLGWHYYSAILTKA